MVYVFAACWQTVQLWTYGTGSSKTADQEILRTSPEEECPFVSKVFVLLSEEDELVLIKILRCLSIPDDTE